MTITTKMAVGVSGLLLALLVNARMGQSSTPDNTEDAATKVARVETNDNSNRIRPALTPQTSFEVVRPEIPSTELDSESEELPTALFESEVAQPSEFVEAPNDAARLKEEEQRIVEPDMDSEHEVDPASEGFDTIEEMEAFVRQEFEVDDDIEIRFSKSVDSGEERLSIAFVPRE